MEVKIKEDHSDSQLSEFAESIYKSQREFPYDLSNGIVDGVYLHLSERVSLRDKYWASMKNQIQVSYVMTRKVLKKTTRYKELPNTLLQKERKSIKVENPIRTPLSETGTKPCTKPCIKICSMPCDKLEVKLDAEPHVIPKVKPRTMSRKKAIAKDMPEIFPKPVFRPMPTEVYLSENDWFKSKYEKEVASSLPPPSRFDEVTDSISKYLFRGFAMLPLAKIIEFFVKHRAEEERIAQQNFLIDQQQKPPSDDVPELKWSGPLIKRCGCDLEDCDCQGDVLLPSKFVPSVKRSTGKKSSNWYTIRPENNLTSRLLKQLEAQEYVCTELKAMGILDMRGAEFCPYRCLHYNMPLATEDSKYFALRSKLLKSFKPKPKEETKNKVKSKKKTQSIVKRKAETVIASKRKISVKQAKEGKRKKRKRRTKSKGKSELEAEDAYDVIPEPTPVIEIKGKSWVKKLEESLPSYYSDQSTQYAATDDNGKFIVDDFSHVIYASLRSELCHVEGQELNVALYAEPSIEEQESSIATKYKNALSAESVKSGILRLFSPILSNDYEDPGIPVSHKSTQDPPLDDQYVTIINVIDKSKPPFRGPCICCELYQRYYDDIAHNEVEETKKSIKKKKTCYCDTQSELQNVDKSCIKNKKPITESNCNKKNKNVPPENIFKAHSKIEIKSCVKNTDKNMTNTDKKCKENTETESRNYNADKNKRHRSENLPVYFVDKCNQLFMNYMDREIPSRSGSKLKIKQSISSATNFIQRVLRKPSFQIKSIKEKFIEANNPSQTVGKLKIKLPFRKATS